LHFEIRRFDDRLDASLLSACAMDYSDSNQILGSSPSGLYSPLAIDSDLFR